MRIPEHQRAVLHLAAAGGFGPQSFQSLMHAGGPEAMLSLPDEEVRSRLKPRHFRGWQAARDAFRSHQDDLLAAAVDLLEHGAVLVVRGEERYPRRLRDVDGAPMLLFMSGERVAEALEAPCAAIVGTRSPSEYGQLVSRRLAADLARRGVTVVSGAAFGVDSEAHQAAMDAGGLTVAVLGTALGSRDGNVEVRRQVIHRGGCISEIVPGLDPHAGTFPQRNRIISGLSGVVIVVEGCKGSGAGITARCATEQGRSVLAVPGDILRPQSVTPNELLKRGARAITDVKDALEALGLDGLDSSEPAPAGVEPAPPEAGTLTETQAGSLTGTDSGAIQDPVLVAVLGALRPGSAMYMDEVVQHSGLNAAETSRGLLQLELMGLCRRGPGGVYARNG